QTKQGQAAMQAAEQFFEEEYKTDQLLSQFSKPIIGCLDGVVMGGGVGLSYGASNRIVTEKTKWAMPEMNISFFPDVGAAYFLNKAPGDRKSTRLNSSHVSISYAVFCLKKKNK